MKTKDKKPVAAKILKFLDLYIDTKDLVESWITAGYSKRNAAVNAAKCLEKPKVKAEHKLKLEKAGKEVGFDRADVLNELGRVAFANLDDYFIRVDEVVNTRAGKTLVSKVYLKPKGELSKDKMAAVSSIKATSNGIEIKLHNKTIALESLKKYFGIDTKAEVEKAGKIKEAVGSENPDENSNIEITIEKYKT